jgi:hypothetical protein
VDIYRAGDVRGLKEIENAFRVRSAISGLPFCLTHRLPFQIRAQTQTIVTNVRKKSGQSSVESPPFAQEIRTCASLKPSASSERTTPLIQTPSQSASQPNKQPNLPFVEYQQSEGTPFSKRKPVACGSSTRSPPNIRSAI